MITLLLALLLSILPAPQDGGYVHDYASVLSAETESRLEAQLLELEGATSAEIALVTVQSLDEKTIEQYANQLFNQWGIGQKDRNNGILVLIAPYNRRTRIEVGYGLEPLVTDSVASDIVHDMMLPNFKRSKYDKGAIEAIEFLAELLLDYPEAARGEPGSTPWWIATPKKKAFLFFIAAILLNVVLFVWIRRAYKNEKFTSLSFWAPVVSIILFDIFAIVKVVSSNHQMAMLALLSPIGATFINLIYGIRKYIRFGPHKCKKCHTKQRLIGEREDDTYLDEVQKLEEEIGSIDYDVWYCPACLHNDTEKYVNYFSRFSNCNTCQARALKTEKQTIIAASYESGGRQKVTKTCMSCSFHNVQFENTAKLVKSSSSSSGGFSSGGSSGGGFGGGSSGGGGASGVW